ncbi:MAG: hypothetical protein J7463_02965 [Roseiflexus sp.]|jgi:hypothetical protein|nr:hypothetical protein [Roseiflexus sp.]MBO9333802.1 hypothetical protein [Roseiflexus sp.]MBO9340689.1 hypothetical protein [Roseiflexus sp.]MBO9363531.1 hypothetical protein [Roseiflexus sp.]MBO9384179.1 hypothetical protein [Roseiflexus sp.]
MPPGEGIGKELIVRLQPCHAFRIGADGRIVRIDEKLALCPDKIDLGAIWNSHQGAPGRINQILAKIFCPSLGNRPNDSDESVRNRSAA